MYAPELNQVTAYGGKFINTNLSNHHTVLST